MTTAKHLIALLRSHIDGDEQQFMAVAMQVAAHQARQGHGKLATQLKELVERFTSMVLPVELEARLKRVVTEQRQQHKLLEKGLAPIRKLLLIGPPGSGKTMTASALAGELNMPLFTVVFDSLITKFMGETASRLRLVFDAMASTRGVYLFDEFDAIGAKRGEQSDVGEIRRVLNSFLQFLENDGSDSLIVAATDVAKSILQTRLHLFDTSGINWEVALEKADGLSQGELTRVADEAAKKAVLSDQTYISHASLLDAIEARQLPCNTSGLCT